MSLLDFLIAIAGICWPLVVIALIGWSIILWERINLISKEYKVSRFITLIVLLVWLIIAFLAGYAWSRMGISASTQTGYNHFEYRG